MYARPQMCRVSGMCSDLCIRRLSRAGGDGRCWTKPRDRKAWIQRCIVRPMHLTVPSVFFHWHRDLSSRNISNCGAHETTKTATNILQIMWMKKNEIVNIIIVTLCHSGLNSKIIKSIDKAVNQVEIMFHACCYSSIIFLTFARSYKLFVAFKSLGK